ncbi:Leucine-rich repeat extensin-like protein 3 [Hibiscus syriacus]|uniref:Leucine-rich repeat extensin-like protein 3 n=1 Tax=Hibiscus syriacus TaxID=106335 RepID=A0A6A2YRK2_HIBSY|nr:Leucine-rich repeat extensin-like protein 3 [Hibiscus syriacus]
MRAASHFWPRWPELYTGVYCAPAPDDRSIKTVAGIDLNHGDIVGHLPEEIGLLTDLAVFHISTNRFCGGVPNKFRDLKLLFELDLSNNNFSDEVLSSIEEKKTAKEIWDHLTKFCCSIRRKSVQEQGRQTSKSTTNRSVDNDERDINRTWPKQQSQTCSDSAMLWHQKLRHMSEQGMKVLVEQKLLPGLTKVSLTLCEHCITSKQHRLKFNTSNSRVYMMYNSQEISKLDQSLWDLTASKVIISMDVIFVEDKLQRKEDDDSTEKSKITQIHVEKEVEQRDSFETEQTHDEQEPESSEAPTTRQSDRVRRRPNCHSDYVIEGRKPIGNKWVFKIKRNGDDQVERYRARLVVKGYAQKEEQLDVKTTFLHGNLEEEIYMLQPEGPKKDHIEALKAQLAREFEMKNLGSSNKILGIQIHRDRSNRKIWLSQKNYLKKILSRFSMQDCKPIYTPLPINFKLSYSLSPSSEEKRMEMSRVPYASTVGSLMFAMICTRPDIAQVVGASVVATSTTEAEYVAATQASKETIWLKMLLEELGHNQEYVSLFCDSQSALHLARNPAFHSRTKHIRVQYHFIREKEPCRNNFLPSLKFLDLRFNEFKGTVPKQLFDKDLDAIFINQNMLVGPLPDNFGNSLVSVMVLADNKFGGRVPSSLGNMAGLEEIILSNNGFRSYLPAGLGRLKNTTVLDVSFNEITGSLLEEIGGMVSLEQLNVAHNMLSGVIPATICRLPKLERFIFSDNLFT